MRNITPRTAFLTYVLQNAIPAKYKIITVENINADVYSVIIDNTDKNFIFTPLI